MSTIDTSTWSPDSSLNTDIGGIPLNADASIQQTWQAIQMLMAALKGDTAAIELTINQPDGTTIVATNQTLTVVDNGHTHTIANVAGLQTALDGKIGSLISGASPQLQFKATGITRNTAPAANYSQVELRSLDSQNMPMWGLYHRYYTTKKHEISLLCYSGVAADYTSAGLTLGFEPNGSVYTGAPTPPSGDNSTKIATTAFVATAVAQTPSDERLKTPLSAVPDVVLDAWEDVQWSQFRFLDAVEKKGESARLHLGLAAQKVKTAFEARGVDACSYGILCLDECGMWSVRYAEALVMEALCQRRRADRLEKRLVELEARLTAMEVSNA